MRAAAFDAYGEPDVLTLRDLPDPEPGPGQVSIDVQAAGVNPADWRVRNGEFRRFLKLTLPFVPGSDVAGVVRVAGPGVGALVPGDCVIGVAGPRSGGAYAERIVLPADQVARVGGSADPVVAAALPLCGLTALQALRDLGHVTAGSSVLVYGASGGVGTLAVQIAAILGARVETVTSAGNREFMSGLGAHQAWCYESSEQLAALAGRFDVAFDAVNALSISRLLEFTARGGRGVTVHPVKGLTAPRVLRWARGGRWADSVRVRPDGADLRRLAEWFEQGRIRPVVERVYPLAQASDAHRRSETGRVRGKLVLAVDR